MTQVDRSVPGAPRTAEWAADTDTTRIWPLVPRLPSDETYGAPAMLAPPQPVAPDATETLPRRATSTDRLGAAWGPMMDRLTRRLVLADLLVGVVASLAALAGRFGEELREIGIGYLVVSALLPLAWVVVLGLARCYERRYVTQATEGYRRVLTATVNLVAVVAIASWLFRSDFARGYALIAFPLLMLGSLAVRAVMHQSIRKAHARGVGRQRVVVIGTERASAEFIRRLAAAEDHDLDVVGVLADVHTGPTIEGIRVLGSSRQVLDAVASARVDAVAVAAWSTYTQEDLKRLAWQLEGTGIDIMVAPNLTDVAGPRILVRPTAGMPLLHVEEPEFSGPRRILKATFDRTTAFVAVVLLAPLLAAVAVAVKLDSRGPALFRQRRVGLDGREFSMLKFRSMVIDAEERLDEVAQLNVHGEGPLLKVHADPRITRVGAFIRRTSIDELPQLWNVVRGQMSLVGPRPPLPREVAEYDDHVHRRFLVPPGITGLWQVSGRSDLTWQESVRLDLDYVENWSIALDISILLRTASVVVRGRGAY